MNGPNARRSFRVRYIRQSQKFQFCNISIAEVQLKTSLTPGIFNRKGEGREGGIGRGKIYHSLNSSLNNCRLLALRRGNGSPAISTRAFKRSSYSCGIRQPRGHGTSFNCRGSSFSTHMQAAIKASPQTSLLGVMRGVSGATHLGSPGPRGSVVAVVALTDQPVYEKRAGSSIERDGGTSEWTGKVSTLTEISKDSNYTAGCNWVTTQKDSVEFHVSVEDGFPRGRFSVGSADAAMAVREGGAEIGEDFPSSSKVERVLGSSVTVFKVSEGCHFGKYSHSTGAE